MEGLKLPPKPIDQHQVVVWSSDGNLPKRIAYTYRHDWRDSGVDYMSSLTDAWHTPDLRKGALVMGWFRLSYAVDLPGFHPTFEEAQTVCLKKLRLSRDDHEFWMKQLEIAISVLTAMKETA